MKIIRPEDAKYVATVSNVKELRLIGEANLEFWNKQFVDKPFQVFHKNGFAEITIAATELVWKGFRFNELTIVLTLGEKGNPTKQDGVFMLSALNSNRFFAFCERTFFSTPYHFAKINLSETKPFSMSSSVNNQSVFKAEMSKSMSPSREVDDDWEGTIFLPSGKYFIAKLLGKTQIYQFDKADEITFAKHPIFDLMAQSNFTGKEWRWRSDAFHAKSKTYSFYQK